MNINEIPSISRKKWKAALNIGDCFNKELDAQLDNIESLLTNAVNPKAIYRIMPLEQVNLKGNLIKEHLKGCDKVVLMAVTLGAGVDELLRKLQIRDMAMAVIADYGASIMVEQICDDFENKIRAGLDGMYMTGRFSPGYGDYPLEEQKRVFRYLDAQKRIGLNLTKSNLMVPRKSITALAGLSDHEVSGKLATCEECVLKNKCELRKEGRTCSD